MPAMTTLSCLIVLKCYYFVIIAGLRMEFFRESHQNGQQSWAASIVSFGAVALDFTWLAH